MRMTVCLDDLVAPSALLCAHTQYSAHTASEKKIYTRSEFRLLPFTLGKTGENGEDERGNVMSTTALVSTAHHCKPTVGVRAATGTLTCPEMMNWNNLQLLNDDEAPREHSRDTRIPRNWPLTVPSSVRQFH